MELALSQNTFLQWHDIKKSNELWIYAFRQLNVWIKVKSIDQSNENSNETKTQNSF